MKCLQFSWKACRQGNTRSSSRAVDAFEENKAAKKQILSIFFSIFGGCRNISQAPPPKTINSERIILKETEMSNCVKTFLYVGGRDKVKLRPEKHCALNGPRRVVLDE